MDSGKTQETAAQKEMSTEEIVEKNKRDAIRLANDVWKIVRKPDFQKVDARTRMRVVQEKVPEFCKAYPAVVRWMVMMLRYSEKAFKEYLNMLQREHDKKAAAAADQMGTAPPKPGDGYLDYIAKQAEYARILYKCTTPHWNVKQAANIYKNEYNTMVKTYKDMQKEEENVKSEFEDEKKHHRTEKIEEIVGFVQSAVNGPSRADVASKLKRVNEIIDFRMKQADDLASGKTSPDALKTTRVAEPDGTVIEMAADDETTVSPEELERRERRAEAERRAEEEYRIAAQREADAAQLNRAASFLPPPPQPQSTHKRKRRRGKKK